jgi:hypothetical protein
MTNLTRKHYGAEFKVKIARAAINGMLAPDDDQHLE